MFHSIALRLVVLLFLAAGRLHADGVFWSGPIPVSGGELNGSIVAIRLSGNQFAVAGSLSLNAWPDDPVEFWVEVQPSPSPGDAFHASTRGSGTFDCSVPLNYSIVHGSGYKIVIWARRALLPPFVLAEATFSPADNQYLPIIPGQGELDLRWSEHELANLIADPVSPISGEFILHEEDLLVSGPMPIRFGRNYGSRCQISSDFGLGWMGSVDNYLLPYNIPLNPSGQITIVRAMAENGGVMDFVRKGRGFSVGRYHLDTGNNPAFASMSLAESASYIEDVGPGYRWTLPDGSKRYYVNKAYPRGDVQNEHPYLDRVEDGQGNVVRYFRGEDGTRSDYGLIVRIESSSGSWLVIEREAQGFIERITTSDGREVNYQYEGAYLRHVITSDGTTSYDYEQPGTQTGANMVIGRVTRSGSRVLENDYDNLRRVTIQRATVDPTQSGVLVQNASFDYSVVGQTKVSDAYGRQTTYEYVNKLITATREPAGRTTLREWYYNWFGSGTYPNALTKITEPSGLVTEYKYHSNGMVKETKVTGDLDGDPATAATQTRTVTESPTALNMPGTVHDSATGLTTSFLYEDPDYPYLKTTVLTLVTATGAVLRTDKFDYTEREAPAPAPATGTIFAKGLLAKRTLALGSPDEAVTDYDYDATGFRTSEIRRSGTADPDVSLAFTPTARLEIDTITDAAGRETTFTYDGRSRPRTKTVKDETDATLAVTATTYNAHGEVTRVDGPRSGPEDWIETDYDQAGRPSQTRAWRVRAKADGTGVEAPPASELKSTTTYHHDLFGNLALVIDPKGHATTHQYDALGRLTHTRRFDAAHAAALLAQYQADQTAKRAYDGSFPAGVAALSVESFAYEPGGQVEAHVDVLGGTTTTLYNSRGQPRKRTHPDGSVLEWRYHPDGRLAKEILRNQTYWQIDYNDIARTVARTLKKPDGTVLASETRAYDLRGNLVSFTDAENAVFTTAYDDLDRVTTATGPAATTTSARQIATTTYDAAGILTISANALGEKTLLTRDALGRVTREEIRDASDQPVRVAVTAYSADHHSATLASGTGAAAIVTTSYADPQGRPLLTRFADGTFARQSYDLAGLPAESRDALDRVTTSTFDALGHLATQTLPDTHLTTFVHNPAGQLLERRMASPQGVLVDKTIYDNAGRPTSRRLVNGTAETRLHSYAYHPATHATWAGLPDTVTDPRGVVKTFSYDDFLRVETLVTDGPASETDSSTDYAYDRRGLITQITRSAPAAGPPTIVSRPRDAYGRVSTETLTLDGATLGQFAPHWDAAGRRDRLVPGTPASASVPPGYLFGHRADGLLASVSTDAYAAHYVHTDGGLPASRWNLWRTQTVATRDALGRPQSLVTGAASGLLQTETLAWRADHTLDSYAVARSAPGAWDETRAYGYDSRGRVTSEGFSAGPAPGQSAALATTFDHDGVGLGVRTDHKVGDGAPAAWQSRVPSASGSGVNAFARVTGDETNAAGKTIPASGVSLGADHVDLWINGVAQGRATHPGWADNTGAWSAALPLDAGAQTLEARAAHPSGHYTATSTSGFTVSVPLAAISTVHDAEGNVTTRTFADGRVQTLTWDAFNQLVKVTERDTSNNGYDWSAAYDALGRRLRTIHQPVVAGSASGAPTTIHSLYDPAAEFLEIAVFVNDAIAWKVHGPDLDGRYGGWNGTGGLEAVLTPDPESASGGFKVRAAVSDAFGNIVATLDGHGPVQRVEWLATRVGGYGPLPNHRAELLASPLRVAESTAWRGRRMDPTGFYWLGARYYETHSGRFLSPDPYGHGSDMSLYGFANGDPVNRFDPDGRFGKDIWGNPYPESLEMLRYRDNYYVTENGQRVPLDPGMLTMAQIRALNLSVLDAATIMQLLGNPNWAFYGLENVQVIAARLALYRNQSEAAMAQTTAITFMGYAGPILATLIAPRGNPNAFVASEAGTSGTTSLYRAVGPGELADINATNALRNLGSAEGKYFTTSALDASAYAKQAVKAFGDQPYTIIKTEAPSTIFNGLTPATVDRGIPAWVIPNNRLPGLTPVVEPTMPIPPAKF